MIHSTDGIIYKCNGLFTFLADLENWREEVVPSSKTYPGSKHKVNAKRYKQCSVCHLCRRSHGRPSPHIVNSWLYSAKRPVFFRM